VPIAEIIAGEERAFLSEPASDFDPSHTLRAQSLALRLARNLLDPRADPLDAPNESLRVSLLLLKSRGALCGREPPGPVLEQLHRVAELTLARVGPDLRRRLWIERRWIGCPLAEAAPRLRRRLQVYSAVAARDPRAMLEHARALLDDAAEKGDDWRRFLLLAAMVGAHASGAHDEADRLWLQHHAALYAGGVIPPHVVYVVNLQGGGRSSP
jgi:hypothetical protein